MEKIEKDKVLAAVVRTFFKYFTLGIIEAYADDPNDMSVYEPSCLSRNTVPISSSRGADGTDGFLSIHSPSPHSRCMPWSNV